MKPKGFIQSKPGSDRIASDVHWGRSQVWQVFAVQRLSEFGMGLPQDAVGLGEFDHHRVDGADVGVCRPGSLAAPDQVRPSRST
jgi:hypothetical protein